MVSIKDINKKIKKNLFDPLDKSKNKFSSFLANIKKNKVKKDLALQKQLENKQSNKQICEKSQTRWIKRREKETSFSKKINHWKWKARKKEWREKTKNRSATN